MTAVGTLRKIIHSGQQGLIRKPKGLYGSISRDTFCKIIKETRTKDNVTTKLFQLSSDPLSQADTSAIHHTMELVHSGKNGVKPESQIHHTKRQCRHLHHLPHCTYASPSAQTCGLRGSFLQPSWWRRAKKFRSDSKIGQLSMLIFVSLYVDCCHTTTPLRSDCENRW